MAQAADQLGVSVDAVRSRIKRGTIAHERAGGRVYVLLDPDQSRPGRDQPTDRPDATNTLISQLRGEIEYLREESRRKDHIIAGLVERIPPQLEAPSQEPRESPESPGPTETPTERGGGPQRAAEEPERVEPLAGTPGPRERVSRPWWRRVFGG